MIAQKVCRTVDPKNAVEIKVPVSLDCIFPIDAILDRDPETQAMIWIAKYSYDGMSNWGL